MYLFVNSVDLSTDGNLFILFRELCGILYLVNVFARSQTLYGSLCSILIVINVSSVSAFTGKSTNGNTKISMKKQVELKGILVFIFQIDKCLDGLGGQTNSISQTEGMGPCISGFLRDLSILQSKANRHFIIIAYNTKIFPIIVTSKAFLWII